MSKISTKKAAALLLLSVLAIAAVAIPTTLAYISVKTEPVVNTFYVSDLPPEEEMAVGIAVKKIVLNQGKETIGAENFRFLLDNLETDESYVLVSDANGDAGMSLLFAERDIGKTFKYQLTEINDQQPYVTYSDLVYNINITLIRSEDDDKLDAVLTVNDYQVDQISVSFENIYKLPEPPPVTGDDAPLTLYLMLIIGCMSVMAVMVRRRAWQK